MRIATPNESAFTFEHAVQLGLVEGWTWRRIAGHNSDIDAGTEDVWGGGGVITLPSTAAAVSVVSSSANDTAAGTGARTVYIEGIDGNYNLVSEILTLNGVGPVSGSQPFLRVYRTYCVEVGSSGVNEGDITTSVGGNGQSFIQASYGGSTDFLFTVPANYTFLGVTYIVIGGQNSSATMSLLMQTREPNTSWRTRSSIDIGAADSPSTLNLGLFIKEKTDIRAQGISTGANTQISLILSGYLVENRRLEIYTGE